MRTFKITNKANGLSHGEYKGKDAHEAWRNMMSDQLDIDVMSTNMEQIGYGSMDDFEFKVK